VKKNIAPQIRIRIPCADDFAIGPGKAALLEAIIQTGSISGAARQLGMSYSRAWGLIESMNQCFKTPVVDTATGGSSGGGARVTEVGLEAIACFRSMEAKALSAIREDLPRMSRLLSAKRA
jgi:molybdate transport system regulatory protein